MMSREFERRQTFTLVARDATGTEIPSNQMIVTATCSNTRLFRFEFTYDKNPVLQ